MYTSYLYIHTDKYLHSFKAYICIYTMTRNKSRSVVKYFLKSYMAMRLNNTLYSAAHRRQ